MKPDLTEAMLRSAATWKAFKEGQELFSRGIVSEATHTDEGWQGVIASGKRPIRVRVILRSATDIEVKCPCPINRATGAVCAHAVASGLACLPSAEASKPKPPQSAPYQSKSAARVDVPHLQIAWKIQLPENWRDALKRGKLSANVDIVPDEPATLADEEFSAWLIESGVQTSPPLALHLGGPTLAAGMMKLFQLTRLEVGESRRPLRADLHARLALDWDRLNAQQEVELRPDPESAWLQIAGAWWQFHDASVIRWQGSDAPDALESIFASVAAGKQATLPLHLASQHLATLQDALQFSAESWLGNLRFTLATPTAALSVSGTFKQLRARLQFRYGDAIVSPGQHPPNDPEALIAGPNANPHEIPIRNFQAEWQVISILRRQGWRALEDSLDVFEINDEQVSARALLAARRRQWIADAPPGLQREIGQLQEIVPIIEQVGIDRLKLSFQSDDGVEVSMDQLRTILAGGGAAKERKRVVSMDITQVLQPLLSELDLQRDDGLITANPAVIEVFTSLSKNEGNPLMVSDSSFRPSATFRADLRPYQAHGAAWLNDRLKRFGGALLADDMGLGKTVQTIAVAERLFEESGGVVLVLMTTSLLGNWRAEWARFAPNRSVKVLHGPHRDRLRSEIGSGDVVLTTYGTLVRDLAWHLRQDYLAVVADEASLIRNPDTDHSKAVGRLRTENRIALTGTPLENGIRDLWSIFRFVQPGWLGAKDDFRERYEVPLADAGLASHILKRLRLKISPFVLRRTKQEVAPELPEKIIIDEFCALSPDQSKVYQALQVQGAKLVADFEMASRKGAARMQMLTALLRLRQACCDLALLGDEQLSRLPTARRSAKTERLLELLTEAHEGGHKVLIFSQFQKQLLEIEKCLNERQWHSLRLDGGTRNRQELVDQFQSETGPPFFLISLKAGGYGLNLTAADVVIHFDPWWNPAAEAQATDRAHRIGQTRPVTVYRLLTRETVEEKVVAMQARKRELAEAIDESGGGDAAGWNESELAELLAD